jgi:circadian clock protein KaiB
MGLPEKQTRKPYFVFTLFIYGMNPCSVRAIENIKKICEEHLAGRYELKIFDLSHEAEKGKKEQIIAVPTLIKHLPLPVRRVIGDLSNSREVLIQLEIQ